jgi:hypothetical protein
MTNESTGGAWLDNQLKRVFAPQPIFRLELIRVLAPLAILGFMSSRMLHADDWLSTAGFHPPALADDYRQPANFAPLAPGMAWGVCALLCASGLATALGAFTRWSAGVFTVLLGYVALADRMASFTVSKISPVIALALALSPAGSRWSIDALRRKGPLVTHVSGGCVRFFQIWLAVFYCSSGICKARHDWLSYPYVLFSHLHDSYQTPISWFAANHLPPFAWTVVQGTTLAFELGAPLWLAWRRTRPFALAYGIAMHALIGAMFGPVIWFALLMIILLVASYAPLRRSVPG